MKTLTILVILNFLISCNHPIKNKTKVISKVKNSLIENKKSTSILYYDYSVALDFINEYTENCNKVIGDTNNKWNENDWIQNNKSISKEFKLKYTSIIENGFKDNPKRGLDFDPIFDAQDFPDIGFTIYEVDTIKHYVKVKGTDWPEFKLTIKVINKNNTTLVDGVGYVNMPKSTMRK